MTRVGKAFRIACDLPPGDPRFVPVLEIWRGRHVARIPLTAGETVLPDAALPFETETQRPFAGFAVDSPPAAPRSPERFAAGRLVAGSHGLAADRIPAEFVPRRTCGLSHLIPVAVSPPSQRFPRRCPPSPPASRTDAPFLKDETMNRLLLAVAASGLLFASVGCCCSRGCGGGYGSCYQPSPCSSCPPAGASYGPAPVYGPAPGGCPNGACGAYNAPTGVSMAALPVSMQTASLPVDMLPTY